MTVSTSDILTSIKNIVVALSNIGGYIQSLYNNVVNTSLFTGPAATTNTTLYTASTSASSHINTINICNTASTSATFSISVVPASGSGVAIFSNCSIPANTTTLWTGVLVVPAGGSIQGSASAATVTFLISGGTST